MTQHDEAVEQQRQILELEKEAENNKLLLLT